MLNKRRFLLTVFLGALIVPGASRGVDIDNSGAWTTNHYSPTPVIKNYQQYLLGGCSGGVCDGTYEDEGCIVLNIARQFNERGGYFCPTQIQIANSNGSDVWIDYYPAANSGPCKWICVDGYKGENCATMDDGADLDTEPMTNLKKGGVTRSFIGQLNFNDVRLFYYDGSGTRSVYASHLGIVKYLEHGVVVARTSLEGYSDCKRYSCPYNSWVNSFGWKVPDTAYLLCADGYKSNDDNSDCVKIDPNAIEKPWCPGWSGEDYIANRYDFKVVASETGDCKEYRCADKTKAFATADMNDRVCTECSTNASLGGADKNGVCTKCQVGEYFDSHDNVRACRPVPVRLTTNDLRYGQGKTKTGTAVKDQCWIQLQSDDYSNCVLGN